MSGQKYVRTLVLIEVLGNEPFEGDLEELARETMEGSFSGKWLMSNSEEVSKEQMAQLLVMQGSSPEFLIDEEECEHTECCTGCNTGDCCGNETDAP